MLLTANKKKKEKKRKHQHRQLEKPKLRTGNSGKLLLENERKASFQADKSAENKREKNGRCGQMAKFLSRMQKNDLTPI